MDIMSTVGLAALLSGLLVLVMAYAMFGPRASADDYRNDDIAIGELTRFDRYFRPALRNFIPESPLKSMLSKGRGSKIEELLVRSGNPLKLRPTEYFGLQILLATIGLVLGILLVSLRLLPEAIPNIIIILGPPIAGYVLPYSYHNTRRQDRARSIRRELPEALDLLVITMNSGKSFEPALHEVVPRLPEGLLHDELLLVDEDLQSGKSVKDSLNEFARRASNSEAESFAKAIAQTQDLGSDVTDTLINQAASARQSYEAAVDKKISRLTQMMVAPLVVTMLPALMIIFIAPNMSQFMSQF